jgi:hypothetical protein
MAGAKAVYVLQLIIARARRCIVMYTGAVSSIKVHKLFMISYDIATRSDTLCGPRIPIALTESVAVNCFWRTSLSTNKWTHMRACGTPRTLCSPVGDPTYICSTYGEMKCDNTTANFNFCSYLVSRVVNIWPRTPTGLCGTRLLA